MHAGRGKPDARIRSVVMLIRRGHLFLLAFMRACCREPIIITRFLFTRPHAATPPLTTWWWRGTANRISARVSLTDHGFFLEILRCPLKRHFDADQSSSEGRKVCVVSQHYGFLETNIFKMRFLLVASVTFTVRVSCRFYSFDLIWGMKSDHLLTHKTLQDAALGDI